MTGSEIKALRTRLKMSQPKFATLVKASPTTVSRWERGLAQPSQMALEAIQRNAMPNSVDVPEPATLLSPRTRS